jgi:5S rRNA maturation endonuclease (ribonuclease M5)
MKNPVSRQKQKKSCSNYKHLEILSEKIRENIDLLLDKLDISDYNIEHDQVVMACPVHGGDNKQACCIFIGQKAYVVNWKCFTHHCEQEYNSGIFGFVQGRLSVLENRKVSKAESIRWCEELFNHFSNEDNSEYNEILEQNKLFAYKENRGFVTIEKELIVNRLVNNVPYYLNRGFSQEFLDKFGVGICTDKQKRFYNRIVVPVFDIDNKYYVGATARTLYEKCNKCKFYHNEHARCPETKLEQFKYSKWVNAPDFRSELFFYNAWFAKQAVVDTQTAILVEGQEDVWRVFNAGISNVMGCFGSSISSPQRKVLEELGVLNIILFPDPDKAGIDFLYKTKEELGHMYNIKYIKSDRDPADHTDDEIRKLIKGEYFE